MKRCPKVLAAVVVACVSMGACVERSSGPVESPMADLATSADAQQPQQEGAEQFAITIEADGSFRPGSPVSIRTVVTGNLTAPKALLRIDAPEAKVAKASGWGRSFRGACQPF